MPLPAVILLSVGAVRMKSVVYADVLLLVNFLIGYFLLRAAGLACAVPLPFGRNILGAVIAAVSTLMLFLPPLPLPLQFFCKAAGGLAVVRAAFCWHGWRRYARLCACYIALNLGLAGVLMLLAANGWLPGAQTNNMETYLAISPPILFWCAAGIYFALRLAGLFLPNGARRMQKVSIALPNGKIELQVLCDTGFSLHDPLGGLPVLLVSLPSIAPKLPGEIREFLSDWFRGDSHSPPPGWKLRWIPTGTAMGSTVLPALMLPVKINPHGAELLPVAFSAQLFNGGECQALASPELLEA